MNTSLTPPVLTEPSTLQKMQKDFSFFVWLSISLFVGLFVIFGYLEYQLYTTTSKEPIGLFFGLSCILFMTMIVGSTPITFHAVAKAVYCKSSLQNLTGSCCKELYLLAQEHPEVLNFVQQVNSQARQLTLNDMDRINEYINAKKIYEANKEIALENESNEFCLKLAMV